MKKTALFLLVVCVAAGMSLAGCAQKPESSNASEAINTASSMATAQEQAKYLVKEANAFINSQQFDEAVKAAKYVLSKLDPESAEAKSILEKAKAEIKKLAEAKAAEMKDKLSSKFGN